MSAVAVDMGTKSEAEPLIKYAGGKRAIAHEILARFPKHFGNYYEPFLGGGAVFFALRNSGWNGAGYLSDTNEDVVAIHVTARAHAATLIKALSTLQNQTDEQSYYYHRNMDPSLLSDHGRAVRAIYLNKTCFNGLYRLNNSGKFNVPYGHRKNPTIVDEKKLIAAAAALRNTNIFRGDFGMVSAAKKGDLVYFDPPYVPISKTSSFTRYSGSFGPKEHERLRDLALELKKRGVHVVLSNSACDYTRTLYSNPKFKVEEIEAPRRIAAKKSSREPVKELIIT